MLENRMPEIATGKMSVVCVLFSALVLSLSTDFAAGQQPVASFFYDERGNITRQDRDTNGDGKMDRSTYYDRQGQIEKVEQDMNFDGKPDIFIYYEAGKPRRQEIASKNDGRALSRRLGGNRAQGTGHCRVGKTDDLGLLSERPAGAQRRRDEVC
jgi:hypothetical protein